MSFFYQIWLFSVELFRINATVKVEKSWLRLVESLKGQI